MRGSLRLRLHMHLHMLQGHCMLWRRRWFVTDYLDSRASAIIQHQYGSTDLFVPRDNNPCQTEELNGMVVVEIEVLACVRALSQWNFGSSRAITRAGLKQRADEV